MMLVAPSPLPHASATSAPIAVQLQTDKQTYVPGETVGIRVIITNIAAVRTTVSAIAPEAPEWESDIMLTSPNGATRRCRRPEGGPLLNISGMYPSVYPGTPLLEPTNGFRSLARWGCTVDAPGAYVLTMLHRFQDPYTGGGYSLTTPPVTITVVAAGASKAY